MREWFVTKQQLTFADQMRAEARTRELTISTFPYQHTDQKLIVFTEAEAKAFAKYWVDWRGCYDDNSLTGHIYACFEVECEQMLKGAK